MPGVPPHPGRRRQVRDPPFLGLALLAGIYLASKLHAWSDFYVQWGLGVIIVLGALGGAFFAPRERKLAELAERDVAAAGDGEVTFSEEYQALRRQVVARSTWRASSRSC